MRTVGALLLAVVLAAALAAQTPARQAQVGQETPAAAMSGTVVDSMTGQPVSGATVKVGPRTRLVDDRGKIAVALRTASASSRFALTDAEGRFTFEDLSPGMPILVVDAPGYLLSAYGQQGPDMPVRQVHIADGQRLTDLVIRAWKPAVITGAVYDEAGEPVVDAPVQVLRRRFETGARRLVPATEARTDDRGMYRIPGLEPGEYVVAVVSTPVTIPMAFAEAYRQAGIAGSGSVTRDLISLANSLGTPPDAPGVAVGNRHVFVTAVWPPASTQPGTTVYPTTFHPSTTDPSLASLVRVGAGDDVSGINLQLLPVRAYRVAGRVTTTDASPGNIRVSIRAPSTGLVAAAAEFEIATTLTENDGSFLFVGVPEGQYVVRALREPPSGLTFATASVGQTVVSTATVPSASTAPTLWAERPISVGGDDLLDLSLPLRQGLRITGRLVFEGASAPPSERSLGTSRVRLIAADGRSPSNLGRAATFPDLTFATPQYPPGRYYLAASNIGPWYLKSIVVNGRDALREPVELSTSDVTNAVVTFVDSSMTLFGNVTTSTTPDRDPGAIVVLFPAEFQVWIDGGMNPLLLHSAITFRDGTFRIPRLVAGDYLLAAYDADAGHNPEDPELLMKLAPQATRVTLSPDTTSGVVVRRVTVR